jgi:thiamine-phosphate pyrophosphorylase
MTLAKRRTRHNLPRLFLVSDQSRQADVVAVARRLASGSGVILRHYGDPGRDALAARLAQVAAARHLVLIVAADWRLAARIGAAGIHLPEAMARHAVLAPVLGWIRRRRALLTIAAHSPAALAQARRLGASAAIVSPVFATASHPGARTIGAVRFAQWSRRAGLPMVALGGMNPKSRRRLGGARVAAMAAVGALS